MSDELHVARRVVDEGEGWCIECACGGRIRRLSLEDAVNGFGVHVLAWDEYRREEAV